MLKKRDYAALLVECKSLTNLHIKLSVLFILHD